VASHEILIQHMQALELQTQETLALVQQQQDEASQRRQLLSQGLEYDDEDDETDAQRALAIKEVDEQTRMHDETQVSLGIVFAQLHAGRTHQRLVTWSLIRSQWLLWVCRSAWWARWTSASVTSRRRTTLHPWWECLTRVWT
jgi:hypothetical protein